MADSIIYKLNNLHHCILSNFAEKDCRTFPDFKTEVMKRFGFENKFGWNIMLNAIYLIDDTELAKISFQKFGLQGPARYDDPGEKYLRLYGILNAIYQQYQALSNLLELYKIDNKKEIIEELKGSRILMLRNKIASHSANYANKKSEQQNKFDVFEVYRYALSYEKIIILRNQEESDKYDLTNDLKDYDALFIDNLYKIVEKAIKKAFNNSSKFKEKLESISDEINGRIVIKDNDGKKIIIQNDII